MEVKKYLILLLFLAVAALSHAQKCSVTGQVLDGLTQDSLEYSSVAIYKTIDSSLVTGVITNQSGIFEINGLDPGTYYIRTQFLGYESKQSDGFTLSGGQNMQMGIMIWA